MRDGWRMTSGGGDREMVDMDPELEAFIPLFPPADLTDPVIARKHLAEVTRAEEARRRAGALAPLRYATCGPLIGGGVRS
jgi:hypothetical protein